MEVRIIILAAGASTRMGQSKQLLQLNNENLIVRAVKVASASGMKPVVVLGANEQAHVDALKTLQVETVLNADWKSGMASSIKAGLNFLIQEKSPDAVLVMVCDQPLLTSAHLMNLRDQWMTTHKPIVASYYAGTAGVPALFDRSLFGEILELSGEGGAKKIMQKYPDETVRVNFPEGAVDLDTPEDHKKFLDQK